MIIIIIIIIIWPGRVLNEVSSSLHKSIHYTTLIDRMKQDLR